MPGSRLGTPSLRGQQDDGPRRTNAAKLEEARHRAIAARRIIANSPELADRVAMLDLLGLLPPGWPRDSRSRPFVPVDGVADWVSRVDHNAWFRGTLAPCSGPTFRVKVAQHAQENTDRKCDSAD
jgi:hypothetical protein